MLFAIEVPDRRGVGWDSDFRLSVFGFFNLQESSMRRSELAGWTFVAVIAAAAALPAQTAPGRAKKPAAGRSAATLVVSCDVACEWKLDGDDQTAIAAGGSGKAAVELGQHVVEVRTEDGKDTIKKEIDVETGGPTAVNIKLRAARIARLKHELEQQEEQVNKLRADADGNSQPAPDNAPEAAPQPQPQAPPPPETAPATPSDGGQKTPPDAAPKVQPDTEPKPQSDTAPKVQPDAGQKPQTDATPAHDGGDQPHPDAVPAGERQVTPDAAPGMVIEKTMPVYPAAARAAHITGTVVLKGTIAKDWLGDKRDRGERAGLAATGRDRRREDLEIPALHGGRRAGRNKHLVQFCLQLE